MATISRKGFSQVEPNHMSGMVTGQLFDQLPVDTDTMGTIIENGRFAKYDYANGAVNLTGSGPWMLIYNEEKIYDERLSDSHKNFAMIADSYTDGEIVPRLHMVLKGDIFTTNAFGGCADSYTSTVDGIDLDVGDLVEPGEDGYLALVSSASDDTDIPTFQVVKVYTMPDGQPGVKLMRIQ